MELKPLLRNSIERDEAIRRVYQLRPWWQKYHVLTPKDIYGGAIFRFATEIMPPGRVVDYWQTALHTAQRAFLVAIPGDTAEAGFIPDRPFFVGDLLELKGALRLMRHHYAVWIKQLMSASPDSKVPRDVVLAVYFKNELSPFHPPSTSSGQAEFSDSDAAWDELMKRHTAAQANEAKTLWQGLEFMKRWERAPEHDGRKLIMDTGNIDELRNELWSSPPSFECIYKDENGCWKTDPEMMVSKLRTTGDKLATAGTSLNMEIGEAGDGELSDFVASDLRLPDDVASAREAGAARERLRAILESEARRPSPVKSISIVRKHLPDLALGKVRATEVAKVEGVQVSTITRAYKKEIERLGHIDEFRKLVEAAAG